MSMQLLASAITLMLSLMLILFFRQMDKNSRSIEKAKKYGDRVKDEIEGFVKERTQNLRDAAIELDAKLSQAIAAVNRLDSIYNDFMKKSDVLTARSSSIDAIEKNVAGAEETIKTVMDMAALAEKNLARVSQESDFVDSLAKKITDARSELNHISKLMPEIAFISRIVNISRCLKNSLLRVSIIPLALLKTGLPAQRKKVRNCSR